MELLESVLANRATILDARRLVHSAVEQIEIDPDAQRGSLLIARDIYSIFIRNAPTRGTFGGAAVLQTDAPAVRIGLYHP